MAAKNQGEEESWSQWTPPLALKNANFLRRLYFSYLQDVMEEDEDEEEEDDQQEHQKY